jgi:hypothetical protein
MKKSLAAVLTVLALSVFLAFSASAADVQNYIPVQGKLTDAAGNPLDGNYTIIFRLYDVLSGGTALCSDTNNNVTITKGLFNTEIWGTCQGASNGQQLYLGVEVAGDGEMTPRQPIFAVPYAWSLRPGASIIGSVGPGAILHIENNDPTGRGLRAYAMSTTGTNYGIVGASQSPNGLGGYFYNNGGGTGLRAESNTGTAIRAQGTGIIQSTALSHVWISGNNLRPYRNSDSTNIDMDTVGGALITRGATAGSKNVMLPITLPAPLYGQNATVTGLDVYFSGQTEFDGISVVLLRRQTGVCATSSCYATILSDPTNYNCPSATNPTGCIVHYNLTSNNVLTADSGILYLTLELDFSGATSWVDIGGVRLTLKHE